MPSHPEQQSSSEILPTVTPATHSRDSSLSEGESEEAIEEEWKRDPENARNWPYRKKWTAVCIVSFYTFVSLLASGMMAPGMGEVAEKYQITNPTILALTLSIFLLSFAIGPLILAPLSEMYGRTWVLHIGNLFTMAFSLGCAFAPNTSALIAFRFLSGVSASTPMACGGGSVSDVFSERDRAPAMALLTFGALAGPAVGPLAGGFIAEFIGIERVFLVIAILCGIASAAGIPFLCETYAPVIRLRKAAKLSDPEKVTNAHPVPLHEHGSRLHILWANLSRPIGMLFGSSVCFILSLYMAFIYGTYSLMFVTFSHVFESTYEFKAGVRGLAYLGLGVGTILATTFGARFADQIYKYLASKNGGIGTPEMRIPALCLGSFFIPIGLFWYGWSAEASLHWVMPIVGSGIFGFGVVTSFIPIQLYLVDSFAYAASAIAAVSLFRSILSFSFPLFGQRMFDTLGIGAGSSLLAGLAVVLGIPFPAWLYFNGEKVRARNPLTSGSVTKPPRQAAPTSI